MSASTFFQIGGTRSPTLLGGPRGGMTNGSNMREFIRTRKGMLAGRLGGQHDSRLGRVVQIKKKGSRNPLI